MTHRKYGALTCFKNCFFFLKFEERYLGSDEIDQQKVHSDYMNECVNGFNNLSEILIVISC